jgi:hypothetical protein
MIRNEPPNASYIRYIRGNKIEFKDAPKGMKTAKLNNCKRIQARKSWIMIEEKIAI